MEAARRAGLRSATTAGRRRSTSIAAPPTMAHDAAAIPGTRSTASTTRSPTAAIILEPPTILVRRRSSSKRSSAPVRPTDRRNTAQRFCVDDPTLKTGRAGARPFLFLGLRNGRHFADDRQAGAEPEDDRSQLAGRDLRPKRVLVIVDD